MEVPVGPLGKIWSWSMRKQFLRAVPMISLSGSSQSPRLGSTSRFPCVGGTSISRPRLVRRRPRRVGCPSTSGGSARNCLGRLRSRRAARTRRVPATTHYGRDMRSPVPRHGRPPRPPRGAQEWRVRGAQRRTHRQPPGPGHPQDACVRVSSARPDRGVARGTVRGRRGAVPSAIGRLSGPNCCAPPLSSLSRQDRRHRSADRHGLGVFWPAPRSRAHTRPDWSELSSASRSDVDVFAVVAKRLLWRPQRK